MFRVEVESLGKIEVSFRHNNPDKKDFSSNTIPGTDCFVRDSDDNLILYAETELSGDDTYHKEFGRKLALTRAIKSLSRDERSKIWKAYFESRGIVRDKE